MGGATISRPNSIRKNKKNLNKDDVHNGSSSNNIDNRNVKRRSKYEHENKDGRKNNRDNHIAKIKNIWFKSSLQHSRDVIFSFNEAMDEAEIDRLQLMHHMYRVIWCGNFKAPMEELLKSGECNVLDVGCSAGTWVAEMAVDYPNSQIFGIDKVRPFPDQKPHNAQFILGDILKTLPFQDNNFDFIHLRGFSFWFTKEDWERSIQESLRVLKPGAYLELSEVEIIPVNAGPKTDKLFRSYTGLMKSRKFIPDIAHELKDYLINTNQFSYIHCQRKEVPIGSWGGKIGQISVFITARMATMLQSKLVPFLGVKESQFKDEVLNPAVKEMSVYKGFSYQYRYYAKKKVSLNEELVVNDDEIKD